MKCGILFSGGKDSVYATYLAKQNSHEISCLISIFSENPDSYMFHTPSITKVKKQAETMNIPLITQETKGLKEDELRDLEFAIQKAKTEFGVEAIVTGAMESVYQKSRIEKICDNLGLKCFNPLWKKNPEGYWDDLLKNKFEIIIIGVSADGMGQDWLGQIIDRNMLNKLKEIEKKFRIHLSFEGGEAETFVLNCPLFNEELKIKNKEIFGNKNSWRMEIELE